MADRKVKFYRACDGGGTPLGNQFPRARICEIFEELTQNEEAELDISFGQKLVAKSLGQSAQGHHHIVLYRVSSDNLPMLYEHGRFRPLAEVINATTDIAEPTHFGFFPRGIIGNLYNHQGPKHAQLATYIVEKTDLDVIFDAIARDDVLASIREAGGVRLFNFRVRSEDLGRFENISLDGMRALANDFPASDIEIVLRATTPDEKRNMGRAIERLATRLRQGNRRQYVEKAKVAMNDTDALSEGREVDVFNDPIVLTQRVDTIPGQKRYLEEESAVAALEDAFRRVRNRLG